MSHPQRFSPVESAADGTRTQRALETPRLTRTSAALSACSPSCRVQPAAQVGPTLGPRRQWSSELGVGRPRATNPGDLGPWPGSAGAGPSNSRARASRKCHCRGPVWNGGFDFRCAQFPKPEYTLLQRLRNDVLGGCTQRVAIATALRVTAEVVR